ncbi:hypothetical protein [Halobacterium sp. R2-5]|uniref:hypothetical protein n=1 Tax=Halobacterium sp. R2-5 TaxID=2715751 RepID=UPI00141DEF68|nr:hypothetical protein [Halobacterium sp. R2-5]NIB99838.1 hypothetical protein [Halobacterium sp. R2-5]
MTASVAVSPVASISARVNADPDVIAEHYDKPSDDELWRCRRERMEKRRNHLSTLKIDDD